MAATVGRIALTWRWFFVPKILASMASNIVGALLLFYQETARTTAGFAASGQSAQDAFQGGQQIGGFDKPRQHGLKPAGEAEGAALFVVLRQQGD